MKAEQYESKRAIRRRMKNKCNRTRNGYCDKKNAYIESGYCQRECKLYKTFPSKIQQAKNFSKAAVKYAKSGFKNRTKEEIEAIKKICEPCDAYYTKGITPRCKHCGCCINLKVKWDSEDCPIGKWKN